ncbi:MAG: hypothetical protein PF495_18960 [Spirochaetales bacterium]|jgi:hypothetical protein|nr:hypothetical protein [Spirochaetales bacterium]
MNKKKIELAKDPDLAGSWAAIRRAAKRAMQVAISTKTDLIVLRNGKRVRVKPGAEQNPLMSRHQCHYRSLG